MRGNLKLLSDSSFPFAAGVTQQGEFFLPTAPVKRVWARLRGSLLTSVVTTLGVAHVDGALALVPGLTMKVDGKEWKRGSLGSFARNGEIFDQAEGVNSDIYTGAAGVVQPFDILVPFSAESAGSVRPIDSLIDGRVRRRLNVEVNWALAAACLPGSVSTVTITGGQLDLYVESTSAFPASAPFWDYRETEIPFQNIPTADAFDMRLPYEAGSVLRYIQLRGEDAGNLTDALFNRISLLLNGVQEIPLADLASGFVQGYERYNFGVTRSKQGYYHIELAERSNDGSQVLKSGLGAQGEVISAVAVRVRSVAGTAAAQIVAHLGALYPSTIR